MLCAAGADPVIFALEDLHSADDRSRFDGIPVQLGRTLGPSQIGYSPDLGRKLAAADIDLLHLHGIWMATSHLAERWAAVTRRPYVISPHGMLDPWITQRGQAKKAIARLGYEHRSWRRANLFHALTRAEAADIQRETGNDAIAVIPNAVDAHLYDNEGRDSATARIVYLGRIHPKKNIDGLIDAWQILVKQRGPAAPQLTIAGWGDPIHVAALQARIDLVLDSRLSFTGPVYGDAKRALIGSATALALPSHSEGLPMVILESWASGIPVAMSQHCNLPVGFTSGAAIDSGVDAHSIAAALAVLLDESGAARQRRRAAARDLATQCFSPQIVSEQWMAAYHRILERNS
ncbi:glycosyltransferase [Sphingomonas insulae]|uniref:Glycosyltransferase n=2 Tax=Sphingomonas insulae TaxID=424800 RepID=A0ABN1HPG9_9SPHN